MSMLIILVMTSPKKREIVSTSQYQIATNRLLTHTDAEPFGQYD